MIKRNTWAHKILAEVEEAGDQGTPLSSFITDPLYTAPLPSIYQAAHVLTELGLLTKEEKNYIITPKGEEVLRTLGPLKEVGIRRPQEPKPIFIRFLKQTSGSYYHPTTKEIIIAEKEKENIPLALGHEIAHSQLSHQISTNYCQKLQREIEAWEWLLQKKELSPSEKEDIVHYLTTYGAHCSLPRIRKRYLAFTKRLGFDEEQILEMERQWKT